MEHINQALKTLILDRNKEMGTVKKMIGQDCMIRGVKLDIVIMRKTHLQRA